MSNANRCDAGAKGIWEHLEQTKEHVQRQEIFILLNAKTSGKKCVDREGLLPAAIQTACMASLLRREARNCLESFIPSPVRVDTCRIPHTGPNAVNIMPNCLEWTDLAQSGSGVHHAYQSHAWRRHLQSP